MKWYKFVLLGFGIGWVLGVCTLYVVYSLNQEHNQMDIQDRVDIYITDLNSLIDTLYQRGVIQDKESFLEFLKDHGNIQAGLKKGARVTFKKAMTYDQIFEAIYKSD